MNARKYLMTLSVKSQILMKDAKRRTQRNANHMMRHVLNTNSYIIVAKCINMKHNTIRMKCNLRKLFMLVFVLFKKANHMNDFAKKENRVYKE